MPTPLPGCSRSSAATIRPASPRSSPRVSLMPPRSSRWRTYCGRSGRRSSGRGAPMADDFSIKANAAKARDRALNLTGTLDNDRVIQLAEAWFPEIRFHEKERFHPIDLTAASQFFGASTTLAGLPEPQPGDPRVPRHPIQVRAEMRFLLETLRHELQADTPKDALWGRFDVVRSFFQPITPQAPFVLDSTWRAILHNIVEAQVAGDEA